MNQLDFHPRFFIILFIFFAFNACVSVNLPSKETIPSENAKFITPITPFQATEISGIQYAWKSSRTANIISIISNCSPSNDPSLETLETEAKSALDNYTSLETHELPFNDRKAIRTLIKGDVDGVPVMMDLLVFKKDGCRYTLSYSGRLVRFENERSFFDQFINGYKVR